MGIVGNKFASNKNLLDLWSCYINYFFYRDDVMVFKRKFDISGQLKFTSFTLNNFVCILVFLWYHFLIMHAVSSFISYFWVSLLFLLLFGDILISYTLIVVLYLTFSFFTIEKTQSPDIERYSDRKAGRTRKKCQLSDLIRMGPDYLPAELAKGLWGMVYKFVLLVTCITFMNFFVLIMVFWLMEQV